jgi:hypothetical protein
MRLADRSEIRLTNPKPGHGATWPHWAPFTPLEKRQNSAVPWIHATEIDAKTKAIPRDGAVDALRPGILSPKLNYGERIQEFQMPTKFDVCRAPGVASLHDADTVRR